MVREVHARLIDAHIRPTSSWAQAAGGALESLESVPPHERQSAIELNDKDIACSNAMLVLARANAGGEMFCEVARAGYYGLKIYWVGRTVLSAYRQGVKRCLDVNAAIAAMKEDLT